MAVNGVPAVGVVVEYPDHVNDASVVGFTVKLFDVPVMRATLRGGDRRRLRVRRESTLVVAPPLAKRDRCQEYVVGPCCWGCSMGP